MTPPRDDDPSSRREQREDLHRLAAAHEDAVWGRGKGSFTRRVGQSVLGLFTGDIGGKGPIAADLRGMSARNRRSGDQVPYGTAADGGGRYIFAFIGVVVLAAAALLALLWWAVA